VKIVDRLNQRKKNCFDDKENPCFLQGN